MLKQFFPKSEYPLKVVLKATKKTRQERVLQILSEEYDAFKGSSSDISQNRFVSLKELNYYFKKTCPGIKIKAKKLSIMFDSNAELWAQPKKKAIMKLRLENTFLESFKSYFKHGPRYRLNDENIETLIHESCHFFNELFSIHNDSFLEDVSRLYKKNGPRKTKLLQFKINYALVKNDIYYNLVYKYEQNSIFNKNKFSSDLNNYFDFYKIENNYEKIIFLRSFLKNLRNETDAIVNSRYITLKRINGNNFSDMRYRDFAYQECEKEGHFLSKEKVLKEELTKAIKFEREMHKKFFPFTNK